MCVCVSARVWRLLTVSKWPGVSRRTRAKPSQPPSGPAYASPAQALDPPCPGIPAPRAMQQGLSPDGPLAARTFPVSRGAGLFLPGPLPDTAPLPGTVCPSLHGSDPLIYSRVCSSHLLSGFPSWTAASTKVRSLVRRPRCRVWHVLGAVRANFMSMVELLVGQGGRVE